MLLPGPTGDVASGLHSNPTGIQPILGIHPRTPLPFSFSNFLNLLLKFHPFKPLSLSRHSVHQQDPRTAHGAQGEEEHEESCEEEGQCSALVSFTKINTCGLKKLSHTEAFIKDPSFCCWTCHRRREGIRQRAFQFWLQNFHHYHFN